MYNEYNLYFDSFTKEYPLILSSLNLTRTRIFLTLIESGLIGLHNKSLASSLLEIYCHSSSSSPSNVLQVLRMFFKFFKVSWDGISPELGPLQNLFSKNERGCPLFIVILEDKLHFELIYLKVFSRLLIGPNSS